MGENMGRGEPGKEQPKRHEREGEGIRYSLGLLISGVIPSD
jgi:hypothetical protein